MQSVRGMLCQLDIKINAQLNSITRYKLAQDLASVVVEAEVKDKDTPAHVLEAVSQSFNFC